MQPHSERRLTATEDRALLWIMPAWLAVAVAVLSFSGVPEKIRQLRTPYAERAVFDASKDPLPGTRVPLPETDALGRNIRGMAAKARRVILAVYGACEDCTQRKSAPLMIPRTQGDLVIVAWMSPDEAVQSLARRYPPEFAMVADPDGTIANELNALWLPRLYRLDSRLRVLECQQPGRTVQQWGKEE